MPRTVIAPCGETARTMVINLKTAKTLAVTIPRGGRGRADEVISKRLAAWFNENVNALDRPGHREK